MRILIIDNTIDADSWGVEDLRALARLAPNATVSVRRAPGQDLPASPRGFDRVILSGSKTSALDDAPWISELHRFVQSALNEGIPYLGVCYGHQTLARVLGGKDTCRRGETPEFGWTKIERTGESVLLDGLPKAFYSFSAHFEEVGTPPPGLNVLARSEGCAVQAFQLEDKPVFGIQFHPERNAIEAERTFEQRRKEKTPEHLLHPSRSKELYDPKIGERIFKNFLELKA